MLLGIVEKYKLHSLDEIAACLTWMLSNSAGQAGASGQLLGRTYDLKAAYKQFGISSQDRDLFRIAVRDTQQDISFWASTRFLSGRQGWLDRVSVAVWFIGLLGLRWPWSAYFDDYTVFAKESLAPNTHNAITCLFNLLGLEFAQSGSKAAEFGRSFRALGVEIDLSSFELGHVEMGHTPERREELAAYLKDILDTGHVTKKQAESSVVGFTGLKRLLLGSATEPSSFLATLLSETIAKSV